MNRNLEYDEPCQSYDDVGLQSEEAFREKIGTLCGSLCHHCRVENPSETVDNP